MIRKYELEKRSCETIEEILSDTKKFLEEAKKKKALEFMNINSETAPIIEEEFKEVKKVVPKKIVKKVSPKKRPGSPPTKNKQVVKIQK